MIGRITVVARWVIYGRQYPWSGVNFPRRFKAATHHRSIRAPVRLPDTRIRTMARGRSLLERLVHVDEAPRGTAPCPPAVDPFRMERPHGSYIASRRGLCANGVCRARRTRSSVTFVTCIVSPVTTRLLTGSNLPKCTMHDVSNRFTDIALTSRRQTFRYRRISL
jgi:hypothetical protein